MESNGKALKERKNRMAEILEKSMKCEEVKLTR